MSGSIERHAVACLGLKPGFNDCTSDHEMVRRVRGIRVMTWVGHSNLLPASGALDHTNPQC
jgi:hypothetical protein